ncbi:MAG: Arc family DNA binding domain-containing protein [candidate division Zixibacteria bacterium]|nr:Arc family DNA binding domain-containing protein [candidate division Zixibacteria bacterium]MDH3936828.1 Arc family DNA binding domain-containing protein [candidate division Zixibacteria bacterium]MDH4033129.1 Arc family DNA binding domain-containing protein [candidate division Zixibacteria bacterium]
MAQKKSFLIRVDTEVLRELRRWADDELRSVNGHIEFLLRKALREAGRQKIPKDDAEKLEG